MNRSSTNLSPTDIARLMHLVGHVANKFNCSPAEAVDRLEQNLAPGAVDTSPRSPERLHEYVGRLRRVRMRRNELVGAPLFRDPAWDMLLDLFCVHEQGQILSVSALCNSAGVPHTTALRQLARLEKHGMVEREGDTADHRRNLVRPTPKAIAAVATAAALMRDQASGRTPGDRKLNE